MDKTKIDQRYQNMVNNAQGHLFEGCIKAGCIAYRNKGTAEIDKTPEPFRVTKKYTNGTFTGRFTTQAQPDFQGTLKGGRSICFEAKFTTTDRMRRSALTDNQMEVLEKHEQLGALAAVCIGIRDDYFFIPWNIWRDMKIHYGRQYVTVGDIEPYRVKFTGQMFFLDYEHKNGRDQKQNMEGLI